MCGRKQPIFVALPLNGLAVLFSILVKKIKITRANVDQKTGKYLTDLDYSKSQMNNAVFGKMCLNLTAISLP